MHSPGVGWFARWLAVSGYAVFAFRATSVSGATPFRSDRCTGPLLAAADAQQDVNPLGSAQSLSGRLACSDD